MDPDELQRRRSSESRAKRSDRYLEHEPNEFEDFFNASRMHHSTAEPAHFGARAVASANDQGESLYEHLLRHHRDNVLDDSDPEHDHDHQHDTVDAASIQSDEDKKLPAIAPQEAQEQNRRPISRLFSGKRQDPTAELELPPEPSVASTFLIEDATTGSEKGEGIATPLYTENSRSGPRSQLIKQSSFYKAALEAAGGTHSPPPPPTNDLETDELLARELEELLQAPPPESALDEELARAFQAAQEPMPPPNNEERDVALALELMQQEQRQNQSHYDHTSSDEELAMRLSKELTFGRDPHNGDDILARQISRLEERSFRLPGQPKMVPEQLQILERIQQDKERELIQKAILESSLHELPDFMEPPDTRVGIPFSRTGNDEGYRFSQELALQEWTAMQGVQRTSLRGGLSPTLRSSRSGNPSDLNRSFSHSLSPALRSGQSVNPIDLSRPLSRGLSQQVEPHNGPRSRLDRSVNVNFIPGRAVAVDVTGRETSIEPRQHISVASTRAAMLMPLVQTPLGMRCRSFEPAVGSTLTGGRSPTLRHNNDQSRNHQASPAPRAQQDPRPHGPPGELLRRGNEETRAAIATGRAHVIVCQGCRNRLHAPKNYSLVLCPTCNTISPGLLADGEGDSSASRGGRDQHLNH